MPSPRVVVVGSINVDLVVAVARLPAAGETVAGGRFARHGGGKSANQAVAAARLGASVAFVGAVGDDEMGDAARRASCARGHRRLAASRGVDGADGRRADRRRRGGREPDRGRLRRQRRRCVAATSRCDLRRATGVVLLGHEVSAAVVVARRARAAAAAGWPRRARTPRPRATLPDVAARRPHARTPPRPPSSPARDDPEDAARALVARTGAAVLITLGARRRAAARAGRRAGPPARDEVDVVDTTGAGDTVNGALAAELAAGRPLADAARFALAAAALSTTRRRARAAGCRRAKRSRRAA